MASAQIDDLLFGYAIQFVLAEIAAGTNLGMTFSLPIEMTMPTIKAQLAACRTYALVGRNSSQRPRLLLNI